MSKKVRVKAVEIQVGKDEPIKLSMKEAKELYEELAMLFDQTVYIPSSPVIIREDHWYDRWHRQQPMWTTKTTLGLNDVSWASSSDSLHMTYTGEEFDD